MIISYGRRYIFVHAPKTGGTALAQALEARAMKDDILVGNTPKAAKRRKRLKTLTPAGRLWKHSTLADIDGIVSRDDLDRFFLFTLVRNPWDRMVSYYHWLKVQSFDNPAVLLAKMMRFEEFVLQPFILRTFRHAPYPFYVTDAEGRERDAHYIRLEDLTKDLAPLEAHLGFSLGKIPRVNMSDRRADYRGYYSAASQDALAQACASDIARFGYTF